MGLRPPPRHRIWSPPPESVGSPGQGASRECSAAAACGRIAALIGLLLALFVLIPEIAAAGAHTRPDKRAEAGIAGDSADDGAARSPSRRARHGALLGVGQDRKSVGSGRSVLVRVELGGGRNIQQN